MILSAELQATPSGNAWLVTVQTDKPNETLGEMLCPDVVLAAADFILLPQSSQPVHFVEQPRPR